jgi:hypothetical protein
MVDAAVLPPYTTVGPSPIVLCTPYLACHHALFQLSEVWKEMHREEG